MQHAQDMQRRGEGHSIDSSSTGYFCVGRGPCADRRGRGAGGSRGSAWAGRRGKARHPACAGDGFGQDLDIPQHWESSRGSLSAGNSSASALGLPGCAGHGWVFASALGLIMGASRAAGNAMAARLRKGQRSGAGGSASTRRQLRAIATGMSAQHLPPDSRLRSPARRRPQGSPSQKSSSHRTMPFRAAARGTRGSRVAAWGCTPGGRWH